MINTNWNLFLDPVNTPVVNILTNKHIDVRANFIRWAIGENSSASMSGFLKHTTAAGEFRSLLRTYGTDKARSLAMRALKRRNVCVDLSGNVV